MKIHASLLSSLLCLSAFIAGCSSGSPSSPPAPVIPVAVTSISPAALAAGSPATTLTITGSGFVASASVQVGGVAESTTFVSGAQLTAVVPPSQLTVGALLPVLVTNSSGSSASGVNLEVDNPVPTVAQILPSGFIVGAASASLAVTGTGFNPATVIQVNGSPRTTTYISATQASVVLSAADLATAGNLNLTAVNPAPGGGASAASVIPVVAVTVASISPAKVAAGSASTTVTVTGTGFNSSTSVQVGGVLENTTFVSSTQVTVLVPANQLTSGNLLHVIATSGSASSASGTTVNLEIDNPVPAIAQLAPTTLIVGSGAASLSVTGSGFVPTTVLQVNGSARVTTYVSATQVSVALTAADLATSGSLALAAANPSPGGGSSAAASVPVNNPLPGPLSLSPSTVFTGGAMPATITVNGTNFLPTSTAYVGSSARTTTYVTPSQITFQLTVQDQLAAARLAITVVNSTPGGGVSPISFLSLVAPTPTPVLTSVFPAQFVISSTASSLYVYGTGLTTSSTIQWNGTTLPGPFSYGYGYTGTATQVYVIAPVPASLLGAAGTASVTASTPSAVQPVSNSLPVSIVNPPAPTLTAISPSALPVNTAATITLTGANFTSFTSAALNGISVPTTYVSSTNLTIAVPAVNLSVPGNDLISVTTPAPGGGTSSAISLTAYIGIVNNSMIYNPVNGLFYISVPSSAGAPYGNSVVSVDPASGTLGTPIFVGSEPNKLAITADGRYLWVGLDGAGAVRKVDLTAGAAGIQFSLNAACGSCASPSTALALAGLPGATDSVVVSLASAYSNVTIAIFDSGVVRGQALTPPTYYYYPGYSLQVNGALNEIYLSTSGSYFVFTYNASGLTTKVSVSGQTYISSTYDDTQIAGGNLYTDFGKIFNAETGSLFGSIYSSGSTLANGSTTADTSLGRIFVLDNSSGYGFNNFSQIQAFNISDLNQSSTSVIPVNVPTSIGYNNTTGTRLTRWGTNGLAFRTAFGVYSLRSSLVKDLSSTPADLGVTLSASGPNATGSQTTYLATVTNAGPAAATNVTLSASLPTTATLISVVSSAGTCGKVVPIVCDLGGLANAASANVTITATQLTAGTSVASVQVVASEYDPTLANNQATSSLNIAGSIYNPSPILVSITPPAVLAGSTDTVVTLNGAGFSNSSVAQLGTSTLSTTYVSRSQLTAIVPASNLASLGWAALSVSTPAPGGGSSSALPLSIYSVLTLGANHIVYDPYTRKIMASVGTGTSTVAGNSIAAINPETQTIGSGVVVGSQPTALSLTSDGQYLYSILAGSNSVSRFNMLTQQPDFSVPFPTGATYSQTNVTAIAAQPGSDTAVAIYPGNPQTFGVYDFDGTNKTATQRGGPNSFFNISSNCFQFLDPANLLDYENVTIVRYGVSANGITIPTGLSSISGALNHFGCFQLRGGLAFANAGGLANAIALPAIQLGTYPAVASFGYSQLVAPDTSLNRVFFLTNTGTNQYNSYVDGIVAYDEATFLPSATVPLNIPATEGTSTSYTPVDIIRWGQDGIAALTSGGHIYLLRGPTVVPQLVNQNTAATLSSISSTTLSHGSGNVLLTLTGNNFIPGVAVNWNGAYRTTTIVDASHVSVAIPASDLSAIGTGSLVATNPGAPASAALTLTIN